MDRLRICLVTMSMLSVGLLGSSVDAQSPEDEGSTVISEVGDMPLNYTQRPITLRGRTLRADVAPSDFGLMDSGELLGSFGPLGGYGARGGQVRTNVQLGGVATDGIGALGIGASYGLVDRLEVGMLLLPINFDVNERFGNLAFYTRAALAVGDVSVGLQGTLSIPTNEDLGVGVGVPINVRSGDNVRIETGVEGELFFDLDDDRPGNLKVNIDVPLAVSWGIGDGFFGGRTGGTLIDVGGANQIVVPVGLIGGYSLIAGPTLIDIKGGFTWTFEFDDSPNDQMFWQFLFGANVHFDL